MINPPTGAAVPQEELEAIRARHEAYKEAKADDAFYSSPNGYPPPSTNKIADVAHTDRAALLRAVDRLSAELAAERERRVEVEGALAAYEAALDPNETKAAYIGEFKFSIDVGAGYLIDVPWTTTKEIMAAIKARATFTKDTQ